MKISCKVIEDLMPLYEENLCSEETRVIVDEHLRECESCRNLFQKTQSMSVVQFESENSVQDRAVKKSMKKIKRYWCISIIIAIVIIPLSMLGWNQYKGTGMSFTNMKELYVANSFMRALQGEEYEKAFEYIDLEYTENRLIRLGKNNLENLEVRAPEIFVQSAEKIRDAGGITNCQYVGITKMESGNGVTYEVAFKVYIGDVRYDFSVETWDKGVMNISSDGSYEDILGYFCAWREWLWADLSGRYWDFEAKEYVYY